MIDPNKKYRTSSGLDVRIYAIDGGGSYPVHGAVKDGGEWEPSKWRVDGSYNLAQSWWDLVEVKPEVTVRRIVRIGSSGTLHVSQVEDRVFFTTLGQIDITHDGEKLIKVEIVK